MGARHPAELRYYEKPILRQIWVPSRRNENLTSRSPWRFCLGLLLRQIEVFCGALVRNAETDARPGVIKKFNSQGLQGKLHVADCHCAAGDRLGTPCFHVSDRVHVDPSRIRYLLLIDPRQGACGF
jgi:hypothetical protein